MADSALKVRNTWSRYVLSAETRWSGHTVGLVGVAEFESGVGIFVWMEDNVRVIVNHFIQTACLVLSCTPRRHRRHRSCAQGVYIYQLYFIVSESMYKPQSVVRCSRATHRLATLSCNLALVYQPTLLPFCSLIILVATKRVCCCLSISPFSRVCLASLAGPPSGSKVGSGRRELPPRRREGGGGRDRVGWSSVHGPIARKPLEVGRWYVGLDTRDSD